MLHKHSNNLNVVHNDVPVSMNSILFPGVLGWLCPCVLQCMVSSKAGECCCVGFMCPIALRTKIRTRHNIAVSDGSFVSSNGLACQSAWVYETGSFRQSSLELTELCSMQPIQKRLSFANLKL